MNTLFFKKTTFSSHVFFFNQKEKKLRHDSCFLFIVLPTIQADSRHEIMLNQRPSEVTPSMEQSTGQQKRASLDTSMWSRMTRRWAPGTGHLFLVSGVDGFVGIEWFKKMELSGGVEVY